MDVRDLAAQHNALAERFKLYEQRIGELPAVEVLNELRYAFRAAIEFIALKDAPNPSPKREQELIARMDHALKCAYHDLIDGLVLELTGFVDKLTQTFPTSTYEVAGSRIADMRHDISTIEEVISQSRREPERRAEVYDKELYDEWFEKLLEHRSYLKAILPDIARLQEKRDLEIACRQEERDRRERGLRLRSWLMLLIGAIVSVVLTILWGML